MEEILNQLNSINNEDELFEKLLKEALENDDNFRTTAALIQAGRDIRFDLKKITKQNDNG